MPQLRADCSRCVGLCCVAPAFAASSDFAIDKPAGRPCPNLAPDHRCTVHAELRPRGFAGCTVFDCFGAGQQVTQVTFAGRDWRSSPEIAEPMFAAFGVMRALHELLSYLADARGRERTRPLHADLDRATRETERLTAAGPDELRSLDVDAHRGRVNVLLLQAAELVRTNPDRPRRDLRGRDLTGRDLRGADLRGVSLRGCRLIGADLRDADLRTADVIGADLRGADLGGADLTDALFLSQMQVNSARGDDATRLPPLDRPPHWRGRAGVRAGPPAT